MWRRCGALFVLDFAADVLCTLHIQACADRSMLLASATILSIYLVGYFGHQWFVEEASRLKRFWLTLAAALGAAAGTATVIHLGDVL